MLVGAIGIRASIEECGRRTPGTEHVPLLLWARTPEPAWARRAVGEGVTFCPRAGRGKSACPVRRST